MDTELDNLKYFRRSVCLLEDVANSVCCILINFKTVIGEIIKKAEKEGYAPNIPLMK